MNIRLSLMVVGALLALSATSVGLTSAASTVVVTPTDTQGWSTADTRTGGAVNFIPDATAPGTPHNGALQLTTDATTAAKAQYLDATNTPLSAVTELRYYTKQISPAGLIADPSYQLITFLNGGTAGFTTLVYEPYQGGQGPIINNDWQQWNIDSTGLFWSTHTITCSNGTINGTSGGPATYTLTQIKTACPAAVVAGFGVNIGTNNPGYNVETDLFDFNGTTYNFEPYLVAQNKDDCKDSGWQNVRSADGSSFKNQGDCIQYVNTGK